MTTEEDFTCQQCGRVAPALNLIPVPFVNRNAFSDGPSQGEEEGRLCDDCAEDVGYRIVQRRNVANAKRM